jgi:hypothetical protein
MLDIQKLLKIEELFPRRPCVDKLNKFVSRLQSQSLSGRLQLQNTVRIQNIRH